MIVKVVQFTWEKYCRDKRQFPGVVVAGVHAHIVTTGFGQAVRSVLVDGCWIFYKQKPGTKPTTPEAELESLQAYRVMTDEQAQQQFLA